MRIAAQKESVYKRLTPSDNKQHGIINYDADNAYPQRIMEIVNSSITAKACIGTYSKFIGGEGFADPDFYKAVINRKNQTVDKLLSLVKADLARYRGFAIHVNVEGTGRPYEVWHVPFEHVRKTNQQKKEESGFDFAVYDNWDRTTFKVLKAAEIRYFHAFTNDNTEFRQQVQEAAISKQEYLGQLFYFSADEGAYPLASCDAALEDILAEIGSSIKTRSNINNNFAAKGFFIHKGKFADDIEFEEFQADLDQFVGPDGSQVILVDVANDEETPEWKPIEGEINDKIFEYTDRKVTTRIIRNWLMPKILLSDTDGAGFFNQEQIKEATVYYNNITVEERLTLEEAFTAIFANFAQSINPSGNYSIRPIVYRSPKTAGPPAGMLDYLKEPIPNEVKRAGLELLFGLEPEDALRLVPDTIAITDGTTAD